MRQIILALLFLNTWFVAYGVLSGDIRDWIVATGAASAVLMLALWLRDA